MNKKFTVLIKNNLGIPAKGKILVQPPPSVNSEFILNQQGEATFEIYKGQNFIINKIISICCDLAHILKHEKNEKRMY